MSRRAILALPWLGKPTGKMPMLSFHARADLAGGGAPGDPAENVARQWSWSLSPTGNGTSSAIDGNSQTRTHDNANEPWHGHLGHEPACRSGRSQGRSGPAVAGEAHGRDARGTYLRPGFGRQAHGRVLGTPNGDAHATPLYDRAGNNDRGPRPPQALGTQGGPQGPGGGRWTREGMFPSPFSFPGRPGRPRKAEEKRNHMVSRAP
jgi:hypothetical protein